MKKILLVLFIGLAVVSCDKNQSAVRKLDGKWNTTKAEVSEAGKTLDLIALGMKLEWSFVKCKLKDSEFCDYSVTSTLAGETPDTENGVFKVEDNGTKLVVASTKNDPISDYSTMTIDELTKKTCVLTASDSTGSTKFTLEKM